MGFEGGGRYLLVWFTVETQQSGLSVFPNDILPGLQGRRWKGCNEEGVLGGVIHE